VSNERQNDTADPEVDAPDRAARPETEAPPLRLIAGDDDLVCVDDTCLPADLGR
jgi:hypothetical protein